MRLFTNILTIYCSILFIFETNCETAHEVHIIQPVPLIDDISLHIQPDHINTIQPLEYNNALSLIPLDDTIDISTRRRLRSRRGSWQGPYRIRGIGSNRCLDISGGHRRNGARLIIWNCHGGANQKWYINRRTREFRVGGRNGKCLDIHGGHYNRRRNGAKLHAWSCHRGQNQKFRFVGKHIRSQGKMSGRCLDVWRGQKRRGAKVILWPCHRGSNQQWKLEWVGKRLGCPRGTRTIGRQGQKNDIGGCGIGGCNSRYRVRSINQCAAKCKRHRRCRSFSWAPLGGDRNHRSKNVCTIYDKRRGNNKWGPNQVMCGKPKSRRRRRRRKRRRRRPKRRRRRPRRKRRKKKRRKRVRKRRRKKRRSRNGWKCVNINYRDYVRRRCIRKRKGRRRRGNGGRRFGGFMRGKRWRKKRHGFKEGYRMGRKAAMNAARMRGMTRNSLSGMNGIGNVGGISRLRRVRLRKVRGGRIPRPPVIRLVGLRSRHRGRRGRRPRRG